MVETVETSLNGHVNRQERVGFVVEALADTFSNPVIQTNRVTSWREERAAHVEWMARFSQFLRDQDPPSRRGRHLFHGFRVGMPQPTRFLAK